MKRSTGVLCLGAVAAALAGCTTTNASGSLNALSAPEGTGLDRLPVYRLSTSNNSGSGVHVGGNLLLTSRHVLTAPRIYVHDVNGWPSALTRYEVIAQGNDEATYREDWALIEPLDVTLDPCPDDVELVSLPSPRAGTVIHLVGFPAHGEKTWSQLIGTPKQFVQTRVTMLPMFTEIPVDPPIYLNAPRRQVYSGLSGGPGVYCDPTDDRLKLVGIYKGEAAVSFLGFELESMHLLVPLPEQVVEIVKGRRAIMTSRRN